MGNNPVNFNDPTGHDWVCTGANNDHCYDDSNGTISGMVDSRSGGGSGGNNEDDDDDIDLKDMTTSTEGEESIKSWEEYREYPYPDGGGNCTIGWGHRLYNDDGCTGWPNHTYGKGITTQTAQEFFDSDIAKFESLINDTITVDITQAQFDALVSYTFNTGDQTNNPYFVKNIPELINSGNFEAAAEAIRDGPNTTGDPPITMDVLIDRRNREADLFLYGIYFP